MREVPRRLVDALSDRYRIGRQSGACGMAAVYLALDLKYDQDVAMKVQKPDLAAAVGADRFTRDVRTIAHMKHPNILPLFDSGSADGFLFYVMPFIEGESLRDRLRREGTLPVPDVVRLHQAGVEYPGGSLSRRLADAAGALRRSGPSFAAPRVRHRRQALPFHDLARRRRHPGDAAVVEIVLVGRRSHGRLRPRRSADNYLGRATGASPETVVIHRRFSIYQVRRQHMPRLTMLQATKKALLPGVFVAALTALLGFQATRLNAQGEGRWTIMIHFQYQDGFEFDYTLERGVATADLGAALAACGASHWTGSVVRHHCYPVAE
jgi:hypothetical protein